MDWLQSIDTAVFRFINGGLSNAVGDKVMPFVSGNVLFLPAVIVAAGLLLWRGGARGRVFLLMALLGVTLSDAVVCRAIKQSAGRQRPFVVLSDVRRPDHPGAAPKFPGGTWEKNSPNSLPSSHTANWFTLVIVALFYYRKSWRWLLPMALLVGFSRIYNGVHYPTDVMAGAVVGAGTGAATVLGVDWLWRVVGCKWFPVWWRRFPSLLHPKLVETEEEHAPDQAEIEVQWLGLTYLVAGVLFVARLVYLAGGSLQLSEDEAYQWLWSKHLDLAYYSKPPLIAYTQFLGTSIWGDTAFGVRFFSPVITLILSVIMARFFARVVNARAAFWLNLVVNAIPIMVAGSLLMTVDPLSVLFWTAAMIGGWRAAGDRGTTSDWIWVGVWMGLGFLSKATSLFQILSWAMFFWLWRPARPHLRRPGPWLALLVNLVFSLPVLIWNQQRHWVTVTHLAERAGSDQKWTPTFRFFLEFVGGELGVLNPIFGVAMIWAVIAFWRRQRHDGRMIYFYSMGAPIVFVYLLLSLRSRVLPNWIVPAIIPWCCLMVIYWDTRWRLGARAMIHWLRAGFIVSVVMMVVCFNPDLPQKLIGVRLPVRFDVLHRLRGWNDFARLCDEVRGSVATEGRPPFLIADHYGWTGLLSFYLPEAKAGIPDNPLVYRRSSPVPLDQFFFWPGYSNRVGQDALFFVELGRDWKVMKPPPPSLVEEFETVSNLGVRTVKYRGEDARHVQFFFCRNLRARPAE